LHRWKSLILSNGAGLAYTVIGNLLSALLGALFWFIIASIQTVEEYGVTNFSIALATVAATIGTLGLNTTVTTYVAKGEVNLLYEANSLALISALIMLLTLFPIKWSAGLLSISIIFFNLTLAEILGKKRYREYAAVLLCSKILQVILSILLYFLMSIEGILLGYAIGYIVFSKRYFLSIRRFTFKFKTLERKRNFVINSYGFGLTQTLTLYLDKVIIAPLFGYHTLGLYQLGYQFYTLLNMVPTSLYFYLLPQESSGESKRGTLTLALALSSALSITTYAISPYLVKTLFPTFAEAAYMVRIICLAAIPSAIGATLNARLLGKERSRAVVIGGLIYLSALPICLVILGTTYGAIGLAYGLLLAQTIQAIYLIINSR
jgi:O-antigen/teichoic acid export membrane protein